MADVQNVITLGIGSEPGNIRYFVLFGLDVNPIAPSADMAAPPRGWTITARGRLFQSKTPPRGFTTVAKEQ